MQEIEINGFAIDKFNMHELDASAKQGVCPVCSSDRKPTIRKQSALLMIGNVVSVLVTIVTNHFNYILITVKVKQRKCTSSP